MNSFFLDFEFPQSSVPFQHGDRVLLMGSCFSDEISERLVQAGHHVISNPFGTVFHPSMLAHAILNALDEHPQERILQRDDLFFSWDAGSKLFGYSQEELVGNLKHARAQLNEYLQTGKYLFVTFGTAWGYELQETNELVANCHKAPSHYFQKVLSSPYELVQDWILALEQIRKINPDLQVVFTVSPVRHVRDGLIENNLSKARLLEAAHQLAMEAGVSYFPSYELITDVLRDYRFFAADKVHPSSEAIDFVWGHFSHTYFNEATVKLNEQVLRFRRSVHHAVRFPESKSALELKEKTAQSLENLLKQHPEICW